MGLARGLTIAAALLALPGTMAAQTRADRAVTEADRQAAREGLARFTRPTLTRFGSEAEFRRYVEAASEFDRTRYPYYYSGLAGRRFAQAAAVPPVQPVTRSDAQPACVPTADTGCVADALNVPNMTSIGVGLVHTPPNPSITHNRPRGVEEGDIVKRIGRHLLVLQHGRIFVIDMRAGDGRRLALTDRADVYRSPISYIRYDEMLVFGDRVLIAGYSHTEGGTELAIFRLGANGRLAREGVFRILSNDYRNGGGHSTRLIGDTLVVHLPLQVKQMARADYQWPVVRRWLPLDDARDRRSRGAAAGPPLFEAAQVYRPVADIEDPVIHSVSVCPLGAAAGESGDLGCRTTAFAGPARVEWHVTASQAFLWTGGDDSASSRPGHCRPDAAFAPADFSPAYLYRVPLSGAAPDLAGVRGFPSDRFAMQADGARLYALARMRPRDCSERWDAPALVNFVTIKLSGFAATLADAPASAYTALPPVESDWVAGRFTDTHLVYGGLSRYHGGFVDLPPEGDDRDDRRRGRADRAPRLVYVLPVARPSAHRAIALGHDVIRAERSGDGVVLTGYRDRGGLIVSLIALDRRPRLASSVRLAGRYESEGRSHAFDSRIQADGSGLIGLPTVPAVAESERGYWRSRTANLDFLSVDARGRLAAIGALERRFDYVDDLGSHVEVDGVPGYECDVSCEDWYARSRPIFADGRVFALSGAELIEGRIEGGRIREVQRLNIALSPPPRQGPRR